MRLVCFLLFAATLPGQIVIQDANSPVPLQDLFGVKDGKPVGEPKEPREYKSPQTAEAYCEQYYILRKDFIAATEQQIKETPAKYDWDKLTFRQKKAILAPLEKQLQQVNSDRKLRFPPRELNEVEIGDVFVSHPANSRAFGFGITERTIGNRTILARARGGQYLLKNIAIGPFEKPGTDITTSVAWHRIADSEIDGELLPTFEPWPYEAEAKKHWEKYLPEQEQKAAKAVRDAAKAKKDKKVETFVTPTGKDKKPK